MSNHQDICTALNEMTASMASVRELIQSIREKYVFRAVSRQIMADGTLRQASADSIDTKEGISLLSLKHHLMLSYLQSIVLLSARRAIGDSIEDRAPPSEPFSTVNRGIRGSGVGDLVDSMIEGRVVLEKIKVLESRMKYQIEKLVRIGQDTSNAAVDGAFTALGLYSI